MDAEREAQRQLDRVETVAGGLLILGQIVELQWHLPKRAAGAAIA